MERLIQTVLNAGIVIERFLTKGEGDEDSFSFLNFSKAKL
jgi:hypothetical protein